jgi:hypothetical protein
MNVFDRLEAQLAGAHPHRSRRALPRPAPRAVLAFAAAAAAVVAVAIAALAGDSNTRSAQQAAPAVTTPPAFDPAKTTVAVLNATGEPGVARKVALRLADLGWKLGTISNYPGATLSGSHIEYLGERTRTLAVLRLARQLGIRSVLPVTKGLQIGAGPDADVVVVLGRDRAGATPAR